MMKKITIFLIALFSISAISCNKFLDEKPASFYTSDNYYKSYQQAQNAVNGIYAFTRDFYSIMPALLICDWALSTILRRRDP